MSLVLTLIFAHTQTPSWPLRPLQGFGLSMEALRNKRIDDLSDTMANHRFDHSVFLLMGQDALGAINTTLLVSCLPLGRMLRVPGLRVASDVTAAPTQRKV